MLCPQSTHRGRGEIVGVYLSSQLARIHHNFACNGRQSERGRACTPPSPGWADFTIMLEYTLFRKWPLPLCVSCGCAFQFWINSYYVLQNAYSNILYFWKKRDSVTRFFSWSFSPLSPGPLLSYYRQLEFFLRYVTQRAPQWEKCFNSGTKCN